MENNYIPELRTIWNEAKAHIEQGDYDKAIEIYKYILIRYADKKVAVEYASAYLGDVYLTLNKPDLAETNIKKAISYNPDKAAYKYQLGFAYTKLKQWKKAVAEFRKAINIEPHKAEYLRGLGWAIYCADDKIKGLSFLLKANQLEPNNINVLNDLSVAYLGLPDLKNAKKYNELVLNIDRSNSMAADILKQIDYFRKHWLKDLE